MDVLPAVNTRYRAYLQSEDWKRTRNKALARARWHCLRCAAKRNVQVHHRTYERLGHERDEDLEVLCRDCHEKEHVQQMHDAGAHQRLYLKLVNDALRSEPFASVADLADTVKSQCARLKIAYNGHQIDKAVSLLSGAGSFSVATTQEDDEELQNRWMDRALTDSESRETLQRIFARLRKSAVIKEMPRAKPSVLNIYAAPPREDFGEHDRY